VRPDRGGLPPARARRVYDRIGRLQDIQAYERKAVSRMIEGAEFERAAAVLDIGCGTGALAARLLAGPLPATARYAGVDVSPRMVALARRRVARFGPRAEVRLTDGATPLPFADGSFDRIVCAYVLDLLTPRAAEALVADAARILDREGRLCVVGITTGHGLVSRAVMSAWTALWSLRPELTGGCRPTDLARRLPVDRWRIDDRETVTSLGIASQVVIARLRGPRAGTERNPYQG
jgi:ubiquinone/menaquinone biosynthesis C-methylase UbiE